MDTIYTLDKNFMSSILLILAHEGGYVDDEDDSGGATNHGISLNFLSRLPLTDSDINGDGVVDVDDIKAMTVAWASFIYYKYFWVPACINCIRDPNISLKFFDMLVNMGQFHATALLQKSCNSFVNNPIIVDGIMGNNTFMAVNSINGDDLLPVFQQNCIAHYQAIANNNPDDAKFLKGWINRVNDMGATE